MLFLTFRILLEIFRIIIISTIITITIMTVAANVAGVNVASQHPGREAQVYPDH